MSEIKIAVAKSLNELIQCQHIRSAAFLTTEPYEEEFDGRDLEMVAHILAVHNHSPIACMRLSHVTSQNGGVIHWGRLAIIPTLTNKLRLKTLNTVANYVDNYSVDKGFNKFIGEVADERLLKFWEKRGFQLTNEKPVTYGKRLFRKVEKLVSPEYAGLRVQDANSNFRGCQQLQ